MFELTKDQKRAMAEVLSGPARHNLLEGGSRSGKTLLICKTLATRAIVVPGSRHAILRFRFNHAATHIINGTWPKMMELCFPELVPRCSWDKTYWFYKFPNGSEVWVGGLDDKIRTEKILGGEYASIFFNECSQISWDSINVARTRLAQKATYDLGKGAGRQTLRAKAYYDCNPSSKGHWTYKLFHEGRDPQSGKPLENRDSYAHMLMNPDGNWDNLTPEYKAELESLPERQKQRFLYGKYSEIAEGALWSIETIEKWRERGDELPDMQRIIVAVDPSGSGDEENASNDAIGIIVAGLGTDGYGYLLEDVTVKGGPKKWGGVVASAFDRWGADRVVAEKNYGGEMVRFVLQTARPGTPITLVNATRGKAVRAEPVSALHEQGRIRFAGTFPDLEDELLAFTIHGFSGDRSPNRADAFVWAMTSLFPAIVKTAPPEAPQSRPLYSGPHGWMAVLQWVYVASACILSWSQILPQGALLPIS